MANMSAFPPETMDYRQAEERGAAMSTGIKNKIVNGFVLSITFLWSAPAAVAQDLPAPIRQNEYADAFQEGYPIPKWTQGHLVAWKAVTSTTDTRENLIVFDREGKLVGRTRVWLKDTSLLYIVDAAAYKDGNVAVVGVAVADTGATAGFLAQVSLARSSARIIQTSPFEGRAVTFGDDGSIWMLGLQLGPDRSFRTAADHNVVAHFGTDGALKDSHLLRSEFPCKLPPAAPGNGGQPQILASADRIGLFAPACHMWVELTPSGELLGQWKWNNPSLSTVGSDRVYVVSVALTSTNQLYARMDSPKGVSLVRFDRKSSSWLPMSTTAAQNTGAPFVFLEGSDGEALVYLTSGKKLAWSIPGKTE